MVGRFFELSVCAEQKEKLLAQIPDSAVRTPKLDCASEPLPSHPVRFTETDRLISVNLSHYLLPAVSLLSQITLKASLS